MKDNKTVQYHRVDPKVESNMFTCKELDWFKLSKEGRSGTIDMWDSETHPTETACANTCNAIKPVTDPTKTIFTLNNPQCVKVCDSYVQKACNNLIGRNYGTKPITKIKQITYKMEQNNTFTYQCNFEYQL